MIDWWFTLYTLKNVIFILNAFMSEYHYVTFKDNILSYCSQNLVYFVMNNRCSDK